MPDPTPNYWQSTTTHPAEPGAEILRAPDRVEILLDAAGFNKENATVSVESDRDKRTLTATKSTGADSTKTVSVRLPDDAGDPTGEASITDGLLSVSFHRVEVRAEKQEIQLR